MTVNKYKDVFEGLGHMPGKIHLETDPSVKPVVIPPRRVPIAIKPKLKVELARLENLDVIEKVVEPTNWVSGLVCVTKSSGKLRVCIDPQPLNRALKRGHYPLPVIEDVLPQLAKVKVYSKADCREGFLQCELDNESSYLTTFQTPWGRYRYKRMPFGISPAPELFQQKLDQSLDGLPGIHTIADDVLITGTGDTIEEATRDHDNNIELFLQRCRKQSITLNREKFEFKCNEIDFIGHVLTSDGLKVDPRKVEAVQNMPRPQNVADVQRFVGMVKYLAKFLPDVSDKSEPLRRLTHKDTEWCWASEQEQSFQTIKKMVTSTPILKYFDPSCETEGQGDASLKGIGFSLLQHGQPITYASRALTQAEIRYSQIEKELLAQVFGLERNHQYAYGRRIVLWTDHKPLVSISNKPLACAPKRLQRLLLRLLQYDVEIRYKPGKEMHLADTLSRAYLNTSDRSATEEETEDINMIDYLPVSVETRKNIQKATSEDATLQLVNQYITNGWPNHKHTLPPETHEYFQVRDELSIQDNIVFKGQRCVIPLSMRDSIKIKLHNAHTGINSTLRRARDCVYWPGMGKELKDLIQSCDVCNTYQAEQQKEPLISHEVPERPWEKIGIDIFTVEGKDYLCTVDYYSDLFEVDNLYYKKDTKTVVKLLKKHFSNHGIPNIAFSDNGPPFSSKEFSNFAAEYQFEHVTSSPTYPQSNGKAENAVKIAKRLIKKTIKSKGDFYLNLLDWRNTPTEGLGSSPAQRHYGRRTKTLIPTSRKLLKPKTIKRVKESKERMQSKQARYYDKTAKELPQLRKGDTVRLKRTNDKSETTWEKAQVQEQTNIRSYRIQTEDGREYRRNRKHLRASKESFTPVSEATSHDALSDNSSTQSQSEANDYDKRTSPEQSESQSPKANNQRAISKPSYSDTQSTPVRRSTRIKERQKRNLYKQHTY